MTEFEDSLAGIGALVDETRRELYRYVCAQPGPVGRDQAAAALDLPHHQVKFHLDRLEEAGLLRAEYARLTGRTGPGAGRPAKLYRRAETQLAVSLPDRRYELAAELMAQAISRSTSTGAPVDAELAQAAREHGRRLAASVPAPAADPAGPDSALDAAAETLARHGYEPRRQDHTVVLANCPFHRLARTHTALVCGMNHALLGALSEALAPGTLHAQLDPAEGRCCVVLTASGQPRSGA
ncbi:helix-turn-helix transcriptional regulator [Jiangella anatolica]|uniref:Transcriptional regulator n=1 Tax=Jiangella anatolica TaxID=2670374 RepID=A0A2W2BHS7_9ACTN|nr:helix-turn-helix domain-containing protein [Jiangella anatolica]PZF85562.1 transcriptional regulator [Jiangella anatolica]